MIKIDLTVHTDGATEKAEELTQVLKDRNFRGVKVNQAMKEPEEGTLGMEEYLPLIELLVKSGVATALITGLFGLLKNGFFTESKKIASQERVEMAKIELEKEKAYIELHIEKDGQQHHLNITRDNIEQQEEKLKELLASNESE